MNLPPPPAADEMTAVWFMQNREVIAAYMQAVYALANLQAVATRNGSTGTSATVDLSASPAILRISVP